MNENSNSTNSVLIAIQARSNSTRFPGKIFQIIGRKMVLQHVIDAAKSSKKYVERKKVKCHIAILYPEGDYKIIDLFSDKDKDVTLIAGEEHDVLSRFINAKNKGNYEYIVRLTSDCPMVPGYMISKHINTAIFNNLDYVNNVHEGFRQCADGFDVEVMSSKAMTWLEQNATTKEHREHVTLAIREYNPIELKIGFVATPHLDTSELKLSLDTEEDLKNIREYFHIRETKMNKALKIYGKEFIYEL